MINSFNAKKFVMCNPQYWSRLKELEAYRTVYAAKSTDLVEISKLDEIIEELKKEYKNETKG